MLSRTHAHSALGGPGGRPETKSPKIVAKTLGHPRAYMPPANTPIITLLFAIMSTTTSPVLMSLC